ncbi:DUF2889 domain-containing protein [Oceanicoccus sp. KOV_DT_Chl]|uniref:DUF2889 domain-containing protein n=1 Tax=Oceanicoccus sp. KOV_DT_Chl TaxID=1904639 RepID=UPI000C7A3D3D|nr:DUF2889 domain-containing protein [Oceanicoccus sp. KOV_DT_Chl]
MPEPTSTPFTAPTNPNYGQGVFRRRVRLSGQAGKVVAELEDCCHGFRSVVYHDGQQVTDIQAEALRIPLTTCTGAVEPIKALIGTDLNSSTLDIHRQVSINANCTHIYDLTLLAIAHCRRGNTERIYDVAVEDEAGTTSEATVHLNQQLIHKWQTKDFAVLEPQAIAGKPMMKGFTLWANDTFDGDDREAAFVLQKGYFVAQARIYDMDKLDGVAAVNNETMLGVCYSYSADVVGNAFRTSKTTRDFTDTPEQLLRFL